VDAEAALALVYLQTKRFAESHGLFAGIEPDIELPVWELMRSFGDEPPYRVDWRGRDAVAIRVIVRGIKGSRASLSLLPQLTLHGDDNCFRPEIERILRGGAGLEV